MPALRGRRLEPTVATLRHRGRYFDELAAAAIPMIFVGMRSRFDLLGGWRAYRLWRLRPDIVFSSSIDAEVIGHLLARRAGAAHVTAEHGGAGLPRGFHRRALVRLVAPHVDRAIAVSTSQLDELRSLGYAPERTTVIPNGIAEPAVNRTRESVRAELEVPDDAVVAIFVATLRPEKRAEQFVEAAIRAHALEPRLHAVVVGGGPDLPRVRLLADASAGCVRVLGERSDVGDLVAASDVVCLSSSTEGLPMIVIEAMALGRAIVSTDVGGISEAVIPGRTGWLVPAGDGEAYAETLVNVARAPAERAALGSEARRVFEARYQLESMVEAYATLLEAVGSARAQRRPAS